MALSAEQLTTVPQPTEDFPEYWLGQIATISDMERRGALTKSQMVSEVNRIVEAMRDHDREKARRAERILRRTEPTH